MLIKHKLEIGYHIEKYQIYKIVLAMSGRQEN